MENGGMTYRLEGLDLSYGERVLYKGFGMAFEKGTIVSILGPSGCGKTTLLNVLGGLVEPQAVRVNDIRPLTKSYIFQEPRLLPWKTVWENVAFVIRERYGEERVRELVQDQLEQVELAGFESYYPEALSGGMKQRVAIARAFAYPSEVLIMDEPFKGLDVRTKRVVMETFLKLWDRDRRTVVFVTHDVEEAVRLGDEIHVLEGPPVHLVESVRTGGAFREMETENDIFKTFCDRLKGRLQGAIPKNDDRRCP